MTNPLLEAALAALRAGLSVHPPVEDGTKAPLPTYPDGFDDEGRPRKTWLHPPGHPADEATIRRWYGPRRGVGIRTGSESGGLECLEFDDAEVYARFMAEAQECGLGHLVGRIDLGYSERTPGGGVHWPYYVDEVLGNTKLAKRPAPTEANLRGVKTLIETRGENGFIIVAPSGGPVHPSGRPYVLTSGGFDAIATITGAERDALFELARSFDRMPRPAAKTLPEAASRAAAGARPDGGGERPGEAFERRTTWAELLEPAGWTLVYRRGEAEYWRRPDKSIGISATTNHGGSGLLWVFSTSTQFDAEKSHTRFGAYTILEHGGDFAAAAKALGASGYGDRPTRTTAPRSSTPTEGTAPGIPDAPPEWRPPRLSEEPPASPFPVDALPRPVASFVRTIAESIGCPPDFAGLVVLIVAGAAIGRSANLMLKPGYFASGALYGMAVGNPTSGKTPSLRAIVEPLAEINAEMLERHLAAMDRYDQEEEDYQQAAKGKKPPRPTRPRLETVLLNDCTTEIAKIRLAENPRGLLAAYDEGGTWIGSLNQYRNGKGTDRQFFLSALYHTAIRIDRMKDRDRPTSIRHPFLSIVGNMTPETLGDIREPEGRSDGMMERILFAHPDPRPRVPWEDDWIDPTAGDGWRLIVRRLRERSPALVDDREVPHVVRLSPEAKAAWVEWYNANVLESRSPEYRPSELGVDGKLEHFAARFALILHLLELATVPTWHPDAEIPAVPAEAVRRAIELWAYFRAHHRRARWQIDGGVENREARSVLDWIGRHRRGSFTLSELTSDLRWLKQVNGGAGDVLDWMEARHLIRKCPPKPREPGQRGQSPSPAFEVNPSLDLPGNTRNTENSPESPVEGSPGGNSSYSSYSPERQDEENDDADEEASWTV